MGSSRRIRIFIADDHKIFRDALKRLLTAEGDFLVVGEASDGGETLEAIKELEADVLLLDLPMPKISGMEVLHSLAESGRHLSTVLLVDGINEEQMREALSLGVKGIVLKESPSSMLFECIHSIRKGLYWIGHRSVVDPIEVLKHVGEPNGAQLPVKDYGLTPRELEIIAEIVSGHSNREIAEKFSISRHTVKHHLSNIFDKVGVYNRVELALFALHHNIISARD
jgi:DNA-binding NarL/FixJ family response regulator